MKENPAYRHADVFTEHRALLFGIAYRMLGSVAEAEDLVQETYLRWQRQDAAEIETPKAWLVATLTRLGIDQLRSARHRREEYVGVWLPEPIVDDAAPAPDRAAALADSLGVAFLFLLETLAPVERAVFLLREVFDYDYAEIAGIVGKTEANCRQMVSRAKATLAQREATSTAPTVKAEQIVRRFMGACATGAVGELLAVLTDDAVLYTDGGGRVKSALRPIRNADRISRFFVGIRERAMVGAEVSFTRVNGDVGVLVRRRDGAVSVSAFAFAGDRIRAIYMINNPDKLRHVIGERLEAEQKPRMDTNEHES
ncbi:MAG TPA: RNA polymerase sigma-70 factor [Opitutus sp.]|nr:RNA polymerase sigma-70 factor [Opitutus sp.]